MVERVLVGTFMSALNMAGASLSLMHVDDKLLDLFDSPAAVPAWPAHVWTPDVAKPPVPRAQADDDAESGGASVATGVREDNAEFVRGAVERCARACVDAEPQLTEYDTKVCKRFARLMGAAASDLSLTLFQARSVFNVSTAANEHPLEVQTLLRCSCN